jgi:hypothetical protein
MSYAKGKRNNSLWARQSGKHGYGKMTTQRLPKPKHVNATTCGKCGAKPGQTCFVLTGTRFIELNETHFPQRGRAPQAQPTTQELATRKRSTDVLDARMQERDRRKEMSGKKINGG